MRPLRPVRRWARRSSTDFFRSYPDPPPVTDTNNRHQAISPLFSSPIPCSGVTPRALPVRDCCPNKRIVRRIPLPADDFFMFAEPEAVRSARPRAAAPARTPVPRRCAFYGSCRSTPICRRRRWPAPRCAGQTRAHGYRAIWSGSFMQRRTPASARPASGCSRIFGAAVRMPTTVPRTRSLRTGRHWTNWYRRTTRLGSTYFGRCGQTEQWIRKSGSSWSRTNRDCLPGSGRSELCA